MQEVFDKYVLDLMLLNTERHLSQASLTFFFFLKLIFLISLRCCLELITDRPAAIQEELDLIQALGCLEEFGVKILPLQGEFSI